MVWEFYYEFPEDTIKITGIIAHLRVLSLEKVNKPSLYSVFSGILFWLYIDLFLWCFVVGHSTSLVHLFYCNFLHWLYTHICLCWCFVVHFHIVTICFNTLWSCVYYTNIPLPTYLPYLVPYLCISLVWQSTIYCTLFKSICGIILVCPFTLHLPKPTLKGTVFEC